MAQMIPEGIPSKASQGEKTLFGILRDRLPDDFIVWYEPEVKGFFPDFLILGPNFGLLILEVKGWQPGLITEANKNFFQIKYKQNDGTERIESQRSPLRQAHDYYSMVTEKLVGYSILRQPDGNYEGKLAFPIGVGAVMSNMTEAQARDHHLYALLEKPHVAYRDELLEWKTASDRALIQRLKDMFKVDFSFLALTDDQISTIKGVIHPEMKIREVPATEDSVPEGIELPSDGAVIVSLDIDQERMARTIKDGHRLFYGVAGSGKTLILLARAKALANRLMEHRILILCFNITLAAHLRSLLHSDAQNPQYQQRIEVRHFHDWARSLLGRLPNPQEFNTDEEYDEFLGERVLASLNSRLPHQKWDSVLVDEAHTFSPKWFLCCVAALKDPQNGDLMVVSDGSQSLYKRQKFTWKSVGIQAQGRSKQLTQNYRNTQEILTAAWGVIQPISAGATPVDSDITFPIVAPDTALRHGAKPVLHLAPSKAAVVDAVINQIHDLAQVGYAPGDIAILYRWCFRSDEALFEGMLKRLHDLGLKTYWITQNRGTKQNYSVKNPGVRIVTALSSLGLEFKVVLLLWVEQFADCCHSNPEKAILARRQLYVAMTRAQDELHLFGAGNATILNQLQRGQDFEVRQERLREPFQLH
ncbi:NERD domain-containing protein [Pantanalinema rosaneae CENA516]|uniref:NERD domain-containing protein n=1 Tax=Pantanalinema rosaneae TaxID=1620701 RepID=UPI003D6EE9DC